MPEFTPDFTTVHANTPVFEKGLYELKIGKVTGSAYKQKKDDVETGVVVRSVVLTPEVQGVYDSKGKLKTQDASGADIKGIKTERVQLYIHSQGAMEFSKRIMMAILGYKKEEEDKFNELARTLDLSFKAEEQPDGSFEVTIGEGWNQLAGKNVKAQLSKGTREDKRTGLKVDQQEFNGFYPV